jgi:hypothetical protein
MHSSSRPIYVLLIVTFTSVANNDQETNNKTTAIARQRHAYKNWGLMFFARSAKKQRTAIEEECFLCGLFLCCIKTSS